jgi:hypothetical protein
MSASDNQKQAFINTVRDAATKRWEYQQTCLALQAQWNALDYGNTLTNADFTGDNEGLTAANIGSVVFDTANADQATFNAGNATNVARIKR